MSIDPVLDRLVRSVALIQNRIILLIGRHEEQRGEALKEKSKHEILYYTNILLYVVWPSIPLMEETCMEYR